ncbi:uncharacterized protein N7498_003719 [Penicillium cinerascens]|uniref:Uncharacterized protein n=1 Tax=Penicillium cinerascens TaxID=70096 RepID=A0A9W9T757_9EURO|nr:uncharacterized protein N7498_003719 [Penicillium cinerascens]KAJ5212073.1 hypothetical protein N7498_003719 [Penicillium cinerascens]
MAMCYGREGHEVDDVEIGGVRGFPRPRPRAGEDFLHWGTDSAPAARAIKLPDSCAPILARPLSTCPLATPFGPAFPPETPEIWPVGGGKFGATPPLDLTEIRVGFGAFGICLTEFSGYPSLPTSILSFCPTRSTPYSAITKWDSLAAPE